MLVSKKLQYICKYPKSEIPGKQIGTHDSVSFKDSDENIRFCMSARSEGDNSMLSDFRIVTISYGVKITLSKALPLVKNIITF